ncbi:MAG TPA: mannosyltransferase family protein [Candidatus Limnocylindrales bacterium]
MAGEGQPTEGVAPWREALVIGIASRLFAIAILVGGSAWAPIERIRPWNSPLTIWDAEWYLWISKNGYHPQAIVTTPFGAYHDYAFFPFWPGLIAAVSRLTTLSPDVVAPALSNLLFVVALIPIYRVLLAHWDRRIARFGLLYFGFNPAAYVYSAGYSEPLFLLAAALFFTSLRPVRSTALAALAMATRIAGMALAFSALADLRDPATRRRAIGTIAAVVVVFAAWWAFIANLTGDPRGYLLGTPSWYAADSAAGSPIGIQSIIEAAGKSSIVWFVVLFLVALVAGTIAVFRRGPDATRLGLFALACVASSYVETWNSMPRIAAVAFPAFAGLAAILPTNRVRLLVFALLAGLEILFGVLSVLGYVVP